MLVRIVAALFLGVATAAAQERCGVAKDKVVQVREWLAQGARPVEFEGYLQLLKQATAMCVGEGDAWYYRSLLERELGRPPQAKLALDKAKFFGSEALTLGLDPLAPQQAPVQSLVGVSAPGEVRNKWALVIGIGSFRDSRIPALRFTAKDAADMTATLTGPSGRFRPDQVRLVTDRDATTVNIKAGLNWLARSAAPEDLVVIYLSSHGSPREMDTAGISYAVTHDTDITSPDSLYATSLPMIDLADAIRARIRARRTVLFLDTCYSGAAVAGGKDLRVERDATGISPEMLARFRQGAGRVVITSSSAREKSWEGDEFANGVFTHFLLDALRTKDGLLPVEEVFNYLRDRVVDTVRRQKAASQVPTLTKSDQGAAIVIGVAAAPAS